MMFLFFDSLQVIRMEPHISEQNNIGGVNAMDNKQKQNKVQPKELKETKPGYGDKKLEGPDRPST